MAPPRRGIGPTVMSDVGRRTVTGTLRVFAAEALIFPDRVPGRDPALGRDRRGLGDGVDRGGGRGGRAGRRHRLWRIGLPAASLARTGLLTLLAWLAARAWPAEGAPAVVLELTGLGLAIPAAYWALAEFGPREIELLRSLLRTRIPGRRVT